MSRYWAGRCECSICGHTEVAVVEIGDEETEPIVPLECAGCGNMTSAPEEEALGKEG